MKNSILFILFLLFLGNAKTFAQYPKLSPEVQAKEKAIKDEANKLSDEAWEKALVIIKPRANAAKPFISCAPPSIDFPPASIPAFPGAEGRVM